MKRTAEVVSIIEDDHGKAVAMVRKNGSVKIYVTKEANMQDTEAMIDDMLGQRKGASID